MISSALRNVLYIRFLENENIFAKGFFLEFTHLDLYAIDISSEVFNISGTKRKTRLTIVLASFAFIKGNGLTNHNIEFLKSSNEPVKVKQQPSRTISKNTDSYRFKKIKIKSWLFLILIVILFGLAGYLEALLWG